MSELFPETGQSSDVAVSPPNLRGIFIPGMDQPSFADGFGLVTPYGGGGSLRRYQEYGPSAEVDPNRTQLRDISQLLGAFGGGDTVYNLEGLVGPQGGPGPPGQPGLTGFIGIGNRSYDSTPNGLVALPYNLDSINDLGTAVDKLVYTSAYNTTVDFRWVNSPIAAVSSWNESDINTAADYFIVAADAGIYISQNGGSSWSSSNPTGDSYIQTSCQSSGGKGIVVGSTGRDNGIFLATSNYGGDWSQKTVETDGQILVQNIPADDNPGLTYLTWNSQVRATDVVTRSGLITSVQVLLSAITSVGSGTVDIKITSDSAGNNILVSGSASSDGLSDIPAGPEYLSVSLSGAGAEVSVSDTIYVWLKYTVISGGYAIWWHEGTGGTLDHIHKVYGIASAANVKGVHLGGNGNSLVATADNGVYLSTDFGSNWTRYIPDSVETTDWILGKGNTDGAYVIVVSDANAIYRSANSGTAWGAITPAGGDTFSVSDLACSDDGQYWVIVGTNSTDATESCYISTDYGVTWSAKKPVTASVAWTECDISNDGSDIAVSTTDYFYISIDSGTTWLEQGMATTAETWSGLSLSGDGTKGLIANTSVNNEYFLGTKTNLYSQATWAESALTSFARTLLDDANAATANTTLGFGTGDSPTLTGLNLSGIANEATDVDKFLVDSSGLIKYRTGAEVLSDVGASSATHRHNTETLEHDAVNSDGGAFSFSTTGLVTFNQSIAAANYAAANLLTVAATNAGALDFSAASKTLTVEDNAIVSQDYSSDANPTFAGLTITNLTQGSVVFAGTSGVISQDNSNLFWDDTNDRLGIGVNTGFDPRTGITISGDADILHTSSEADDHAFELDVDAAGYGDVKAIDIDYITGAIAAGEDEGIILINIDEIAATGGDVFGVEVLATEGAAGSTTTVYGLKAAALVGPIHQNSGTFVNPAIGTNDTPQTPVANMIDGDSGPTKRTTIFVAVDDYIIIGATAVFQEIEFILTTPTSNPGIKPTFWYSTGGSGFTEFTPVDGTNGFRNTGVIAWDASDLTGHAVNADTGAANTYDIKIIRTKAGSLSPSPILGYAKTAATTEYLWDKNGDVNINSLTLATVAAEGSDVDKFLVNSSGIIKYRTGTQVLSDIGASASGHNHSGVYEPADAGLTSLAALSYVSDSFIKVTAIDTYAIRTIAQTKADLSLNNVTNVATDDTAYNATSWDANTDAPTKNTVRDKVETLDTAIGLNTTHRGSNGSDHSIVGSNTTAIGLNTTHRGLTSGNPHSVTPTELSLVIGTDVQAWGTILDDISSGAAEVMIGVTHDCGTSDISLDEDISFDGGYSL